MKRLFLLITILFFAAFLTACGGNDETTETPNNMDNNATTGESDAGEGTTNNMDENETGDDRTGNTADNMNHSNTNANSNYMFTSFELEVEIDNDDDAVEVDYDVEPDETEVSYEHKPQGINLHGDEALNELDEIFTSFQFDENTPDDEVIREVLEAFDIPENPHKVELEIEFANGVEKEYNQ